MAQNPVLDEKDLAILRLLALNSRLPFTEIGRRVGLSDVAVIKRVRKLEGMGIIKRYTIVVDPAKLGYRAVSITGIDIEPQNLFQVVEKLRHLEEVAFLSTTAGDHHAVAIVVARNGDELRELHSAISRLDGVRRVCPAIIVDVVKELRPAIL